MNGTDWSSIVESKFPVCDIMPFCDRNLNATLELKSDVQEKGVKDNPDLALKQERQRSTKDLLNAVLIG
jgi:hypothetical protein